MFRFACACLLFLVRNNQAMGIIRTSITISNPSDNALAPITVNAVVDTGATHLCIPEHVAIQLRLSEMYKREVTVADGRSTLCPYVGPVQLTFQTRGCFTGALVLGDEVLLGAVPMEDMDLILSPARQSVEVNPKSPNIPMSMAK